MRQWLRQQVLPALPARPPLLLPQPFPHLSAPQEGAAAHVGAAAQVGAAAAHVGAAAAQVGAAFTQEGAATPHEGATFAQLLQPLLQQRVLAHLTLQQLVSQQLLSQPQPLEPSIRSSRSNPKLWVQAAMLSTNDPTKMFHFIERRLLNTMEPRTGACPGPAGSRERLRPSLGMWLVARVWTGSGQSNCPESIAGLLGGGRHDAGMRWAKTPHLRAVIHQNRPGFPWARLVPVRPTS